MESAPRKLYGCYQNVPLSDEEYTGLSETIPELPRLIDKMSCHCESTGRTYRNYAATLRKWYFQDEDKKKQALDAMLYGKCVRVNPYGALPQATWPQLWA